MPLSEEWSDKKNSKLYVYRTLSAFMKEHFDGVAFSYDKNKEALINDLRYSSSFASTHNLVEHLESYSYFSLKEVKKVLDAAVENNQFGWIVTDYDVSDFLNRIAVPHLGSISDDKHKEILQPVVTEEKGPEA